MNTDSEPDLGVYSAQGEIVHRHQGGEYCLTDVVAVFELGRVETAAGETRLTLDDREVRQLKLQADAYSFDYEEGFIDMCLDIHRFTELHPAPSFCFTAHC